jgi:hypothetical protein
VEALSEVGILLMCFATTGIVLGVNSWVGKHARFDSAANEAGARIAVAWLVSAAVTFLVADALADQRFRVLFGAAAPWTILIPSVSLLALGAAGIWVAARSDDGHSAELS